MMINNLGQAWWRNGSASDSSAKGCVFKSGQDHSGGFTLWNRKKLEPNEKWAVLVDLLTYFVLKEISMDKPACIRRFWLITDVGHITPLWILSFARLGGATVARLTPVQKVACSNHDRVTSKVFPSGNGQAMNGG